MPTVLLFCVFVNKKINLIFSGQNKHQPFNFNKMEKKIKIFNLLIYFNIFYYLKLFQSCNSFSAHGTSSYVCSKIIVLTFI